MSRVHTAINGAQVEIVGDDLELSHPATSIVVFFVNGRAQEFTAGYLEFGKDVEEDLGLVLEEEYDFARGLLRIASGQQVFPTGDSDGSVNVVPLRLATWEGEEFSVHTHLYGGATSDLINVFDQFVIVETGNGLRLIQKRPETTPLYSEPKLLKEIPVLGLLQIRQLTAESARALPRWAGTPVAGGELFVQGNYGENEGECGEVAFYLAGRTAVTFITPDPHTHRDPLMSRLSSLDLTWGRSRG